MFNPPPCTLGEDWKLESSKSILHNSLRGLESKDVSEIIDELDENQTGKMKRKNKEWFKVKNKKLKKGKKDLNLMKQKIKIEASIKT